MDYEISNFPGYNDQTIYVNSVSKLQEELRAIYINATSKSINFGGGSTLLSHLEKTLDQNAQQGFSSILYLMFIDGEFERKEGYWCNSKTYPSCHKAIIDDISEKKIFRQDDYRRLSKDRNKDEVVLIGMANIDKIDYKNSLRFLLETLFMDAKVTIL